MNEIKKGIGKKFSSKEVAIMMALAKKQSANFIVNTLQDVKFHEVYKIWKRSFRVKPDNYNLNYYLTERKEIAE